MRRFESGERASCLHVSRLRTYTTSMFVKRYELYWLAGLFLFLGLLYAALPSLGGGIFASPDETAHVVAAQSIADNFYAARAEPLAKDFPWMHPRSYVSVGFSIAPVGFLGWPALLALVQKLGLGFLQPWIGLLILLSAVWPAYQFLKKFGQEAAWVGTLIVFTFPSVILYGNRSLFTSGIVFAGALWSTWVIRYFSTRTISREWYMALGALCAFVVAVRPIEMIWILPWWLWAGWYHRPSFGQWRGFITGAGLFFLPLLVIAKGTYGSWFGVGYALKDNSTAVLEAAQPYGMAQPIIAERPWWIPYGFSFRTLLWNGYSFFVKMLWPWAALIALAKLFVYTTFRWRRPEFTHARAPFWLMLWTTAVLFIIYGGGRYADHIRPDAVTIGNSFLRYLLPLTFFLGVAVAWLWRLASERFSVPKRWLWAVCLFLVCMGVYKVYAADDEGILTTRRELVRYAEIRQETARHFSVEDVIVSARSDKIFFPQHRAVSPLPPAQELSRLARQTALKIGLFSRPLSQAEKDAWRAYGFDVQEIKAFGRERLYRLIYIHP
jgi:hypothetical protein